MQEEGIEIPISNDPITSNRLNNNQITTTPNNYPNDQYNNNNYNTNQPQLDTNNNNAYPTIKYPQNPQTVNIYNSKKDIDDIRKKLRNGFIRKVYSILLIQFIFTFGLVLICQIKSIKNFLDTQPVLCIILISISILVLLVSFIIFLCNPNLMQKVPKNYIFLISVTIAETILLIYISILYEFKYVLGALVLVIGICLTIFVLSCLKKIDLHYLGILLIVTCVLGLFYGILVLSYRDYYLEFLYCLICAFLFTLFLIYDTQRIKYPNNYGEYDFDLDDYIIAVLTLYFDIIRMFIEILKILGSFLGGK